MRDFNIHIRPGTPEDIPAVLALIRELAVYEKAGPEVEVTEAELLNDGFGSDPAYGLLVAESPAGVIGIALHYWKYSTWKGRCLFLEDLIVSQAYRRQGIGAQLFEATARLAKVAHAKRFEWQVLEWNEPAIGFYRRYHALLDGEWLNGKLVYDQLQAMP